MHAAFDEVLGLKFLAFLFAKGDLCTWDHSRSTTRTQGYQTPEMH